MAILPISPYFYFCPCDHSQGEASRACYQFAAISADQTGKVIHVNSRDREKGDLLYNLHHLLHLCRTPRDFFIAPCLSLPVLRRQ
jgi:hypothetical protein